MALTKNKGREIVADQPKEACIEAVDRSLLYGFKDEIVIRISVLDGGARVEMRSRSRIGRIDRGVNAKRVRSFLAAPRESAGQTKGTVS